MKTNLKTVREAASELGCGLSTVRRAAHRLGIQPTCGRLLLTAAQFRKIERMPRLIGNPTFRDPVKQAERGRIPRKKRG